MFAVLVSKRLFLFFRGSQKRGKKTPKDQKKKKKKKKKKQRQREKETATADGLPECRSSHQRQDGSQAQSERRKGESESEADGESGVSPQTPCHDSGVNDSPNGHLGSAWVVIQDGDGGRGRVDDDA